VSSASRAVVSGAQASLRTGYDLDTRARDDITVLDKLNIREAVFVGHSVSGTELNKLGAAYPDRVRKLVYLDALDNGSGGWTSLPQPPAPPEDTAADLESVQRFAAASARSDGYRKPLAAICNMVRTDPSGRVIGAITPPEISRKINEGLQPADYDRIKGSCARHFQCNHTSIPFALLLVSGPCQARGILSQHRGAHEMDRGRNPAVPLRREELAGHRTA
jgi:pimeloyl-ACP methyl ester carboxylesterase